MFRALLERLRASKDERHRWDIADRIARLGWTAIYVGDYQTAPTWAYTIGFRAIGAPEIVVFDLPQEQANGLFHELFRDLKAGLIIREGERWRPHELEKPFVWREVHPSRFEDQENPWLGISHGFALATSPGQGVFQAFQLVLSDPDGRLPWEPGYDERLRHLQRALWEPAELAEANAV